MEEQRPAGLIPPLILALLLAMTAVLMHALGTSAWDLGDGALRYLQALYAPTYKHLFFDRWAKPVFVLLASPFAQWGPAGLVVFNALLAWLTSLGILSLIPSTNRAIGLLVPVLLFTSLQYFHVLMAGLTEPLFGLFTILCLWLLAQERHKAALAVVSLLPWTRPEYVVFAPFVILWVVRCRKWHALPWLLLGTLVYFSLGWALLKERIWHFARDPYEGGADYGTGPLLHFLWHAPDILGHVLLVLAVVAIPALLALLARPDRHRHLFTLFLAVLPVLGIWAIHSYAYWAGGHASGGLLRVLSTATPLTVLFVAYTLNELLARWSWRFAHALAHVLAGMLSIVAIWQVQHVLQLPAKASVQQQLVERAAREAARERSPGTKVYSMHPYFAVVTQIDLGDTAQSRNTRDVDPNVLGTGDLVQWDPFYGDTGTMDLVPRLLADPRFAVRSADIESEGPWQTPFSVWLFQRTAVPQVWTTDTVVDLQGQVGLHLLRWREGVSKANDGHARSLMALEHPLEIGPLVSCGQGEVLVEWVIQVHLEDLSEQDQPLGVVWILETVDSSVPMVTQTRDIGPGSTSVRFHQGGRLVNKPMRAFLWNADTHSLLLRDLRILRRCAAALKAPFDSHRPVAIAH